MLQSLHGKCLIPLFNSSINTSISVESAHALLKLYLTSSQYDLFTTWSLIEQAVTNQIKTIKNNAAKDRICTPLYLNQAQYSACFGYITVVALRKAHANYTGKKRPFTPCTGVFTATTGLPCAHKIDQNREFGLSLVPSDFHPHWFWDRYTALSAPTLEPIREVSYTNRPQTQSTRRLPSGFEASEPRERRCGLCRLPGHTRASLRCLVNIRRIQEELDSRPQASNSPFISREEIKTILDSVGESALKSSLQLVLDSGDQSILKSTIQSILDSTSQSDPESTSQPELELTSQPDPESTSQPDLDTRLVWPGRPELIYRQYLTEKEAWLSAHPLVRPSNYRSARGLESFSIKYCKEQTRFLPIQRLDLRTESLIEGRPHWSTEEIHAWLDNEALQEQDIDRQVEAELVAAGGFGQSGRRGVQGLWNQIGGDIEAEKARYRFR